VRVAADGLVGRVVRFYYAGGTEPGFRVVKVEQVRVTAAGLLITGKDVVKGEYRSFNAPKIRGDIGLVA
jgi:hypothetical protein